MLLGLVALAQRSSGLHGVGTTSYFRFSLGAGGGAVIADNGQIIGVPELEVGLTGLLPLGDSVALQLGGNGSFTFLAARFGLGLGLVYGL